MRCGDCRRTMGTSCCPDSAATRFAFVATRKRNYRPATYAFADRRTCAEPVPEGRPARGAFPESPDRATCHPRCCSTMQTTAATQARHLTTSIPPRYEIENPG